jgi:hypothetical protein
MNGRLLFPRPLFSPTAPIAASASLRTGTYLPQASFHHQPDSLSYRQLPDTSPLITPARHEVVINCQCCSPPWNSRFQPPKSQVLSLPLLTANLFPILTCRSRIFRPARCFQTHSAWSSAAPTFAQSPLVIICWTFIFYRNLLCRVVVFWR